MHTIARRRVVIVPFETKLLMQIFFRIFAKGRFFRGLREAILRLGLGNNQGRVHLCQTFCRKCGTKFIGILKKT